MGIYCNKRVKNFSNTLTIYLGYCLVRMSILCEDKKQFFKTLKDDYSDPNTLTHDYYSKIRVFK